MPLITVQFEQNWAELHEKFEKKYITKLNLYKETYFSSIIIGPVHKQPTLEHISDFT